MRDVAAIIRSKNSGPYELTFDVIFNEPHTFQRVADADIINRQLMATLYGMDQEKVLSIVQFPPALAIKVTILRPCGSGDLGERDVYGAQQHAPLMGLEFDIEL